MTLPLKAHQTDAIEFAQRFQKVIIAHDVRLGKTRTALEFCARTADSTPALIVCPAHLRWVWQAQVHEWFPKARVEVLVKRSDYFMPGAQFYVVSYEWLAGAYRANNPHRVKFPTMVVDECHYLKSIEAKRTGRVYRVARHNKYLLLLSGTIMPNRPAELFVPLQLTGAVKTDYNSYTEQFCDGHATEWGWDDTGSSHEEHLRKILRTVMHFRSQADALSDIPERTRLIAPLGISITKTQKKEQDEWIREIKSYDLSSVSGKRLGLEFEDMSAVRRYVGESKIDKACDYILMTLELSAHKKLVCFAWHKSVIKEVRNRVHNILQFGNRGYAVSLTGEDSDKTRRQRVEAFREDQQCKVFIGQLKAAGTGIALNAASEAIFIEPDWTPGTLTQAEGRLQTVHEKPVPLMYHYLVDREGGLDEYMLRRVMEKDKLIEEIVR